MSQLYVRVMTSFYTHRKTAKLRIKFGKDAYWIVPRLWAYAAENQPDGNFSKYTSEEMAELIGCSSNASEMLQALKDCGFVDKNGMIHDWKEHNGYHKTFSERAKKAADARWSKEKSPIPPIERGKGTVERGDKHCLKHACSIPPVSKSDKISLEKELVRVLDELKVFSPKRDYDKGSQSYNRIEALNARKHELRSLMGVTA